MLAAAGIVVTEISTPISAPDFAGGQRQHPRHAAQAATKNVKKSGLEITFDRLWLRSVNSLGVRPVSRKAWVAR